MVIAFDVEELLGIILQGDAQLSLNSNSSTLLHLLRHLSLTLKIVPKGALIPKSKNCMNEADQFNEAACSPS